MSPAARLNPGAVAILIGAAVAAVAGPVEAQPLSNACQVQVTDEVVPPGSERGIKVNCKGFTRSDFKAEVRGGDLWVAIRTTAVMQKSLATTPLECTVSGPAFYNTAAFHCPAATTDEPTLTLRPIECGVQIRNIGLEPMDMVSLSIVGEARTLDHARVSMLGEGADVAQLLNEGSLRAHVIATIGPSKVDAEFKITASQCVPAPDRTAIVPLLIGRCEEARVSYHLDRKGITPDEQLKIDWRSTVDHPIKTSSPWLQPRGPDPRMWVSSGILELQWPADRLCSPRGSRGPVVSIPLPEIGRELRMTRDGHLEVVSADRKAPVAKRRGPHYTLYLEGEDPGGLIMYGGGTATWVEDGTYDIVGFGEPAIESLSSQLGECEEVDGDRICPIVERPPFDVLVTTSRSRRIIAPFDDSMSLVIVPGFDAETMRGRTALSFLGGARGRIDDWMRDRWPGYLTVPGYLWRTPSGELSNKVYVPITRRALVDQVVVVPASSKRYRDPLYWALRSHGWVPRSRWVEDCGLGPFDPIAEVTKKLEGAALAGDYLRKTGLVAETSLIPSDASRPDQILRLHLAAAALLLRVRTARPSERLDVDATLTKACELANDAWMLGLPRAVNLASDDVMVDLALIRLEACSCVGGLIETTADDLLWEAGHMVNARPYYREHYLDLKASLDLRGRRRCRRG